MKQLYGLPYVEVAYKPRAGGRTPMQWNSGKNKGFSTADPDKLYLPVDGDSDAPNVADQEKDSTSLLNRLRKLIQLKKEQKALAGYTEWVPVYARENSYPFIYARARDDETILVIFNPSALEQTASFTLNRPFKDKQLFAGSDTAIEINGNSYNVRVSGADIFDI